MNSNSSHTPEISVCMVCYNHAAFVGTAMASVLRQTFADFEFLILDNGSTDASLAVMQGFDDARISMEALPKNIHSTCAANHLLSRARGRYVAMICSDDAGCRTSLRVRQPGLTRTSVAPWSSAGWRS